MVTDFPQEEATKRKQKLPSLKVMEIRDWATMTLIKNNQNHPHGHSQQGGAKSNLAMRSEPHQQKLANPTVSQAEKAPKGGLKALRGASKPQKHKIKRKERKLSPIM